MRAALAEDADGVYAGLAPLDFSEPNDPRFDPVRVLHHLRAINAWYVEDRRVTLSPQYVTPLLAHAGDPRSECWDLMRNETIPSESLLSSRMRVMMLGAIGQLSPAANWHRVISEWLYGAPPTSPLGLAEAEVLEHGPPAVTALGGVALNAHRRRAAERKGRGGPSAGAATRKIRAPPRAPGAAPQYP